MAFDQRNLDDYIDVAQRIADFRKVYPDGSLTEHTPWSVVQIQCEWCRQCIGRRTVKADGKWKSCPRCQGTGIRSEGEPVLDTFIVYVAAAYRTPDDPKPGIGTAWEPYPGQTPYTAGSELMNAETSAWGRAIIAVGASDSKPGIASRDEVRNRRAERDDGLPVNKDGSLSRSQTTDEEKDAAGVMTDAQQAEHTALKPERQPGRTTRANGTPAGDPFYDGAGPPLEPTESHPGSASPDQLRKIGIRMSKAGITDRAMALQLVREVTGREIQSRKELSFTEAAAVLKELEQPEASHA